MKSLRSQLQRNYIVISVLAIVLVLAVILINRLDQNAEDDFFSIDPEEVCEEYLSGGLGYAFSNPSFTEEDAIEILDANLSVTEAVNSRHSVGYTYTQEELNDLVNLSEEDSYILWSIADSGGQWMLIHLAPLDIYYDLLIIFSIIAGVLFIAAVYFFSVYTGKRIIEPINKLTEGAAALEAGNLDYRIHFNGNNELTVLRDTFNAMSQKLGDEIRRREHVEENRKTLIRNISHDIKTPLTNIIGYSQTLLSDNNLSGDEISNALSTILKNGLTANCLVSELFDLSKLDMDMGVMARAETDLAELFRIKIIDYIPEFELKHIGYTIDIPEKSIMMPMNAVQFNRALDNLIQNSIKYNGEDFDMAFGLVDRLDCVEMTIADHGIGIPAEYADIIFEPTVRADASRHTEGSGLGLAITRKIIEAHDGSIYLDTREAKGCRFVITMPKDLKGQDAGEKGED